MERMDRLSHKAFDISSTSLIQSPLTEAEILDLQDMFLSEGIHQLKVRDVASGRTVINTFLDSLAAHHGIACLSVSNKGLESYITNIYHELLLHGYIERCQAKNLEEFFIDQFYFDFLWIECSSKLLEQHWFADFQMNIQNFRLDRQMPIFMISYEDKE